MADKVDYAAFLSEATRTRPPSSIRSLFPAELIPGMISFLAGKPNASTFPLQEMSLTFKPDAVGGAQADGKPVSISISGADLVTALQYGPTAGIPKLVKWLTDFVSEQHKRPVIEKGSALDGKDGQSAWSLTVGNGSQDLLGKAFDAILDPGDTALVEEPAYSGILPQIFMLKATALAIGSDEEGLCPHKLRAALEGWSTNPKTSSLKFPKMVYTTPTGANPSGTTASEQRKRDVLQVVQEFNILLFEDDPYYYLSFVGLGEDTPQTRQRTLSYWALEEENREQRGTGRVIRFDSMSKIMSAGLRIGFATGPCAIIDAICGHTAVSNLQPAGPTQAIALALLQHWGRDGFLQHADTVATFYKNRRDHFEAAVTRILGPNSQEGTGKQIAEWVRPVAGMFLWLKLKLPPTDTSPEGDSFALISEKARANLVLALPGASFVPGNGESCYVRMSFSIVPEDQIETGLIRLRKTVEEAWKEAGLELPVLQNLLLQGSVGRNESASENGTSTELGTWVTWEACCQTMSDHCPPGLTSLREHRSREAAFGTTVSTLDSLKQTRQERSHGSLRLDASLPVGICLPPQLLIQLHAALALSLPVLQRTQDPQRLARNTLCSNDACGDHRSSQLAPTTATRRTDGKPSTRPALRA